MNWIVFSYTVPAKPRSSFRVSIWRRLGRLGAISTTSGVYILPARDECVEALQWLAQETRQAGGDALVMRVEQFEGLLDAELIERFNQTRSSEYREIETQAAALEQTLHSKKKTARPAEVLDAVGRLRRRYLEIARVDYFNCAPARPLAARLDAIEQAVTPRSDFVAQAPAATLAELRGKRWVTRPRPHVDRLACAWLIRRYVDPQAVIRYGEQPEPGEIAFDMSGAHFGHVGSHCTFEALLSAFALNEPALHAMAEIIHEIDLRDGQTNRPETQGIDAVLSGWLLANFSDGELEAHGVALFEGLHLTLASAAVAHIPATTSKRRRKG